MPADPILIVDDSPDNLDLAAFLLTRAGYCVRTASSAEGALAVLETFRPKLILMDIQLPGMDGLELTRKLKADSKTSAILVIAYTAYAMREDENRARMAGCDGYITKPVSIRTLRTAIVQHLGHGASLSQRAGLRTR